MDQNPISFENIVLPKEHQETLESIGREVAEKQVDYSATGVEKPRKDVFKEVLGQRIQAQGSSSSGGASIQSSTAQSDADNLAIKDKGARLQELVNIAAMKGPVEASLMAKKFGDPWLEDQFHDTLISFHDELVRRKKLSED